ncbi:MAG TPA: hypothetical protein DCM05_18085 [Elusimicrobia bacterium]|nr:hypothetical protein [Elusimicrobiota bacterium]
MKTLKSAAVAECRAMDITVGRKAGQGPEGAVLNVQPLVDQVFEEAQRQLPGAGVGFADPAALEKGAEDASGDTARHERQTAKADAKAAEMEAQMANMPPQVAAMMKSGMMGGNNPMAAMMKKKMKGDDASAEAPAYDAHAGGFNETFRDAAGTAKLAALLPSSDQFSRKSKDERAVKFFKALDAAGADGWVILKPKFEIVGKDKVKAEVGAQFYDANGKKLAMRSGDAKAEIKSSEKGKATPEEITAAFKEAIAKATEDLVKILNK